MPDGSQSDDGSSDAGDHSSDRGIPGGQKDGGEHGSAQDGAQLALQVQPAAPGGGTSEGGSAKSSPPLEYAAPVDSEAIWPRVQEGDAAYTIVYPGQLPTVEQFGARLSNASLEELKSIHEVLRIRRSGGREVYRSRLLAVHDSHPIVAVLALCVGYCQDHALLHRDKSVLDDLLFQAKAEHKFAAHSVDDLFFDSETGKFFIDEPAKATPQSRGGGSRRGSTGSRGSESSQDVAEMRDALADLKREMSALRADRTRGGGGGGSSGHVPAAEVTLLVQQAVAAEREQFISDVRSGKIVIDGHASKADRRAASTWQLSDEFVVFDSEWTEKREDTPNLYDAGEATSLRDLVFKNPTRDQDATKISRSFSRFQFRFPINSISYQTSQSALIA
jgi:hypothetical protein